MIIYRRMMLRGLEQHNVGLDDGIFWMTLEDFVMNFRTIYMCKVFNDEY